MTPNTRLPESTSTSGQNAPTGHGVAQRDVTHRPPGGYAVSGQLACNVDVMPRAATSEPVTTPAAVDTAPALPLAVEQPALQVGELLTCAEVAELLRVDVYSVRRWTRKGELGAYRIGRELRIPQAALDTFLGARRAR